jgi:hypothetical protein
VHVITHGCDDQTRRGDESRNAETAVADARRSAEEAPTVKRIVG